MRINKYLAVNGYATRREADTLIEKKKVLVNGELAVLGQKVEKDDLVEIRAGGIQKKYVYFAYHKPQGVITHSPQEGEDDIKEATKKFKELRGTFPVGRLDKDSYGLIILTNDGRITDRLLNPDYAHDKEYLVKTKQSLRESFKRTMEAGVDIEGYKTKKCRVERLGDYTFRITLTEGKKHQIRRMVAALHNEVADLKRTRILSIELRGLPSGAFRPIEGKELERFLKEIGL